MSQSPDGATPQSERARARRIARRLQALYPDAVCSLDHRSAYQLIVATILSAQCTDERVNQVTPALFRRCPDPKRLAAIPRSELEDLIRSTGFFRSKAKNLQALAQRLVAAHGGEVPNDLEALTQLPGVGRKTAQVVLGTAFGEATGIVVDTHVRRISKRLGLTRSDNPTIIERDLMALLPKTHWIAVSHRLIAHGRAVCRARSPRCDDCGLRTDCPRIGVDT